ncbi:RNA polymerase sigma factor [Parapedobacter sp.]
MAAIAYKTCSDSELIGFILDDDHRAYLEVYERYSPRLYFHACRRVGNRDDVKDLLQDVFSALWHNRHALSPESSLGGYLYATLRYRTIKLIAQKKAAAGYAEAVAAGDLPDPVHADHRVRENELGQLIEEEIVQLPPKMQEVFRMSRQHYRSHKEIADELGLSEMTVKKHVNNALKVLRQKLGTLLSLAFFLFF